MTDHNEQRESALLELSSREMEQVQGGAQADYFLKIKGIDGDVTTHRGTHVGGGGGGAGKVSMQDFHFI